MKNWSSEHIRFIILKYSWIYIYIYIYIYSTHLNNIRDVLLKIPKDILSEQNQLRIGKIVINSEFFSPLNVKLPLNVKFPRGKGYNSGTGNWFLPLMGPFGLAASSLGVLASALKNRTQHLSNVQTYSILSKSHELSHALYCK